MLAALSDAPLVRCHVPRFVFTPGSIDAGIRQGEFRDRLSSDDVRINDLVDVLQRDPAVPYGVWVHHYRRAMFALLQTSRLIGADSCTRDLMIGQLLFEGFL
jgi:hypothetical protein